MITEELKIVITADTQDAINKVKAVKNNLADISKSTGVSGMKSSFSEGASAASQLAEKLSSIRSMSFHEMVAEFATLRTTMKNTKSTKLVADMNLYKESIVNATEELKTLKDILQNYEAKNPDFIGDMDDKQLSKAIDGVKRDISRYEKYLTEDTKALKKAQDAAHTSSNKLFGAMSKGAKVAAGIIGTLVAVVATLGAAMKTAADASQRIRTDFLEASKVGLTTAAYQEWSYVLDQVGVGADKLSDFIKSLSAAQNDLRDGSEDMTKAFKDLGFNIDEVVNMGQEELFTETIKRLQQMEDQVKRTGIAYRIFGEDDAAQVANLMALNNQEMERMISNFYLLGGAASDSAIEKSLTLQSAISSMRLAWQGLANTIGEAVMPALTAIVRGITRVIAFINMFLRAVFGFDIVASSSKSVNKASASMGGYSNSVKEATAAAKELRRTTMGFDELNIVSDPNKDAGGSSGADTGGFSGGGGSFDIPELSGLTEDLGLEGMAAWIEKYKTQIKTLTPILMTVIGLLGGAALLATGHWIAAIPLLAMGGLGIAIGFSNGTWEKIFGNIGKTAKKALQAVAKLFKNIFDGIVKAGKATWNSFTKFLKTCWEGIKKIAKAVWDPIANFFKTCWNGIKNTATTIWNAIAKFFSNVLDKIKSTVTTVWNAIKTFLTNIWNNIKNTATTVWNAVTKFFSDTWNSIKSTATNAWNSIKQFLSDTWNNIKNTATNIWNAIKQFFATTWENIKTAAINAWNNIKSMLETSWNAIKTAAEELCEKLKEFFQKCWEFIKETWSVVKDFFIDIWDGIKSAASTLCENLKSFFSNAWNAIKNVWDAVKSYFQNIWDSIKNAASAALESIKGFFSSAWSNIKSVWGSVTTWFGNIWSGIKNAFSGVADWFGSIFSSAVTKIKNAWANIKGWFSDVWNGIKEVFTSAGSKIADGITGALKRTFNNFMSGAVGLINRFIRAINRAIGVINKIPGVNISTLGELSVPQLAKGGIVTDSILANIGERGREAVLPLENNTGWMDVLADRIAARSGPTRVVLQVDGRELGWATIENINSITKQTGGLQLTLV